MNKYDDIISKEFETAHSGTCTVVSVVNKKKIKVEFKDGFQTECTLHNLRAGSVYNPLHPKNLWNRFYGHR